MLLDADKTIPPLPPTNWRWPSQWPWLIQGLPILVIWFFDILTRNVHPYWEYASFGCATIWLLWASWDIASNPSNPYESHRSQTRRNVRAMIGVLLWLLVATWFFWPFGVLR